MEGYNDSISICIVVRNEPDLLEDCLSNVSGFASEVIVVDNGSTDNTLAIAQKFNCIIIDASHVMFDQGRNLGLEAATNPWVLMLDADERISEETYYSLSNKTQYASNKTCCFSLPIYNYYGLGRWATIQGTRLIRSGVGVHYNNSPIHASVEPSVSLIGGEIALANAPIQHLDGLIQGRGVQKRRRNVKLLHRELKYNSSNWFLHAMLGIELAALKQYKKAERMFLDASLFAVEQSFPHLLLAHLYVLVGSTSQAISSANVALDLISWQRKEIVYSVLTKAYFMQGERQTAMECCFQALSYNNVSAEINVNAAHLLRDRNPGLSVKHLETALQSNNFLDEPVIYRAGDYNTQYRLQDILIPGERSVHDIMLPVLRKSQCLDG